MKDAQKRAFFDIMNIPDQISRHYNLVWLAICVKRGKLENPPPAVYFHLVQNMYLLSDMAKYSHNYLLAELGLLTVTDKRGNLIKIV